MYLSYGDKLRLVNYVLSSLPTFYMSTLRLYQWVIKEFDKYRRHCLCRRKDLEEHGQPLAAWEMVCKPKDQGGLGVVNLSTQNNCLLMKHLHKFYNKANLPWVKLLWEVYYANALPPSRSRDISFWWRDCLKILSDFKGLTKCSIGTGSSVLLWIDSWINVPLNMQLPHLYSFTVNEVVSIHQGKYLEQLSALFHLPLSNEAFAQFQTLQDFMMNLLIVLILILGRFLGAI
jgi:mannosylglycoprotein endo-beta-mannosidase